MTEERSVSKTFLFIVAALMVFAGPTYVVYALSNMIDLDYFVSAGAGFAIFVVGLILLVLMVKKKILA